MGIACSLARAIPVVGFVIGIYIDYLIIYALIVQRIGVKNGFITINWTQIGNWVLDNLVPDFLRGPIKGIYDAYLFMKDLIPKPEGFVSSPVKYKKQLNNTGGISWVPYYGKPGRLCKKDKDCPTFQKCKKEKCVIPMGVY